LIAIFITSSAFDDDAVHLASANNIDLINGEELLRLIRERSPGEVTLPWD